MRRWRSITALLVVGALGTALTGCGGDDNNTSNSATSTSGSSGSAPAGGSGAVKISDFAFVPATLTVKMGRRPTVTNDDSTAHTATADDGRSFDTGVLDPGTSKTIRVSKPGRYAYHCSIHSFMHGTIVVR